MLKSKINVDLYIINDLYKEFKNLSVTFKLDDKKIGEIKNIVVKENNMQFINWEGINVPFPEDVDEGLHKLDVELLDYTGDFVISGHEYYIKLTATV